MLVGTFRGNSIDQKQRCELNESSSPKRAFNTLVSVCFTSANTAHTID